MTAARTTAAWGVLLAVSATVLAVWSGGLLQGLPLYAAAVVTFAVAGATARRVRELPEGGAAERPKLMPTASPPAVLAAVSVALILAGSATGVWLSLIGAGALVVAVAGLIREALAGRRR